MKLDLDSQTMDIPCQACGKKIRESIGRLKRDPDLTCSCGAVTHINAADLRKGAAKVEKSLADIERQMKKMFK